MNNKKVKTKVTMDSRVISCFGSVNFKQFRHSDLPRLIEEMENNFKNSLFVENYYLIYHDETDTPHIHYVLELTGQKRLKTLLNDFEKFGYGRESVNIDKLGSLSLSLKYFIHQDENSIKLGKKPYKLENIVTNISIEFLEDLINLEDDTLNVARLIEIILDCDGNKVTIMKRLGLQFYHKWRFEINDILNYEWSLRMVRDKERERREKEGLKELPF